MSNKQRVVKEYFEKQWTSTFYPPKDVKFVIYSKKIWDLVRELIKDSREVVDLGAGGVPYCLMLKKFQWRR